MAQPVYEKLATFYLGKRVDPAEGETTEELLLYDAKDLTTHAVCVGMTGSGKTGLCISLLEEAAIDRVPALVIDPKGDLGNLLLTFPELTPADFRPWIEEDEAARKGLTADAYAADVARTWREGLAAWGQDGDRIRRFRDAVDLAIYTPGSTAGLPLQVLRSFEAPPPEVLADGEALRDRIQGSVASLLALLDVSGDPLTSREHILLARLLEEAWRSGRDLSLADLVRAVQSPPFDRVGVIDVESFFPAKDRFALAMRLNNLLASPGFAAWREGEPLDIGRLLATPAGKPRLSILSIAHLSDSERMFFVSLLLNEVVAWMRTRPGSTSLKALLYMDEVFGFLPPTRNPPSKIPMLTLLKQARAFGLGVVLATQNPVDLDYKALSNAGTWFLGRLQTERDKLRVLDGLEGAASARGGMFDRAWTERVLSGLGSRTFLLNNVHEREPVLFRTRWAMSYLRGPLTRRQIERLMAPRKAAAAEALAGREAPAPTPAPTADGEPRPVLPPEVPEAFVWRSGTSAASPPRYRPALLAQTRSHYHRATLDVDHHESRTWFAPLDEDDASDVWDGVEPHTAGWPDLEDEPVPDARFAPLPAAAARPASYRRWSRELERHIYREYPLHVFRCKAPKAVSAPGETEGEFRGRLVGLDRERRDLDLARLRKRYEPKVAKLNERIRRAEQRVEKERGQYESARTGALVSLGTTILGALFGRTRVTKGTVGKAGTTVRGAGRAWEQREDIQRAKEDVAALRRELDALEAEAEEALDALEDAADPASFQLESVAIRARRSDVEVPRLELAWVPG